ncbi:alpha-glucosidase [Oryzibacter oryziterrae]|uniref:alpha-glucosidase n=1 Tax=Oryzibacter oryziterrae TaxID=2766474 RepID=UPI001F1E9282|nr:alpha-glucosidase [Oryzibacter oryziterrae]
MSKVTAGATGGMTMSERRRVDPDWWRGAVIYQVYPRSYADSNGDGVGDLKGVTEKLDHIASLGVDAVWLSPFFTSPMDDFGYDVSDYCDVDPMFGTLADFDALVKRADELGLGIIIDLVLSHTSDQHPWFKESRRSRDNPKADWYVWAEPKEDGTVPNNWLSIFGGPAWEWNAGRRQYFMHNFLTSQPDLNFHNPAVQDALLDVARFWLDRGVAGFRLDTVNFYFCDAELRDNPPAPKDHFVATVQDSNPYARQLHYYDKSRPENLVFLSRLRTVMDRYPGTTSVGELGTDENLYEMMDAYTETGKRLHMAYSFELLSAKNTAEHVRRSVTAMLDGAPHGWPSWALSNHDFTRVVTRWGHEADAARFGPLGVALVTSLKGTACVYQGEELALTEAEVPFEALQDPYGIRFWPDFKGRDGCRTPMVWSDNDPTGGFSAGKPWLPVPDRHLTMSVARQELDPTSPLHTVRRFLNWRRTQAALRDGDLTFLAPAGEIVAFERRLGADRIVCAFNLAATPAHLALPSPATPLAGHGFEATATLAGQTVELSGFGVWFGKL